MSDVKVRIISGGRVTIPKKFRKELELKIGDIVLIRVKRGQIEVIPTELVERRPKNGCWLCGGTGIKRYEQKLPGGISFPCKEKCWACKGTGVALIGRDYKPIRQR